MTLRHQGGNEGAQRHRGVVGLEAPVRLAVDADAPVPGRARRLDLRVDHTLPVVNVLVADNGVAVDSAPLGSLPTIQNNRQWLRAAQRFPVVPGKFGGAEAHALFVPLAADQDHIGFA